MAKMEVDDVVDLSLGSGRDPALTITPTTVRDLRALTQNSGLTITPAPPPPTATSPVAATTATGLSNTGSSSSSTGTTNNTSSSSGSSATANTSGNNTQTTNNISTTITTVDPSSNSATNQITNSNSNNLNTTTTVNSTNTTTTTVTTANTNSNSNSTAGTTATASTGGTASATATPITSNNEENKVQRRVLRPRTEPKSYAEAPDIVLLPARMNGRQQNGNIDSETDDEEMPPYVPIKELTPAELKEREKGLRKLRDDLRNEETKLVLLKKLKQSQHVMKENIVVTSTSVSPTNPLAAIPAALTSKGALSVTPTTAVPLPAHTKSSRSNSSNISSSVSIR